MRRRFIQAVGIGFLQAVCLYLNLALFLNSGFGFVQPLSSVATLPFGLILLAPGPWRQSHLGPIVDALGNELFLVLLIALNIPFWFGVLSFIHKFTSQSRLRNT